MNFPAAPRILLLSRRPERHFGLLEFFQRHGTVVRVASGPSRALKQLRLRPSLVFVDLAHGARLSPAVIRELNRARRSRFVVGLHEGTLEHLPEDASALMPVAYLDGRSMLEPAWAALGAAGLGSMHVH